jgi:hypothetical protein
MRSHPQGSFSRWLSLFLCNILTALTAATFAIAYIMTKFTEPVRLGVTLLVVPKLAKWLGYRKAVQEEKKEKAKIVKEQGKENAKHENK